jgi:hypothetical protein
MAFEITLDPRIFEINVILAWHIDHAHDEEIIRRFRDIREMLIHAL